MNQLELDLRTQAVLDRIRHSSKVLSIYEMPSDLAEAAVWEIGKLVLDPQHLPLVQYNVYRWYLREMSKLLRTKSGWDLALELELCLRKWVGFCLDPVLLQALMRECCERIAAMSPEEIEESPKSEARMTNQPGKLEGPKTCNEKPETKNEPTTVGGGNG